MNKLVIPRARLTLTRARVCVSWGWRVGGTLANRQLGAKKYQKYTFEWRKYTREFVGAKITLQIVRRN